MANIRTIEAKVTALLAKHTEREIKPGKTYGTVVTAAKQPWAYCITSGCFNDPCRADMRERGCPIIAVNFNDLSLKPPKSFRERWPSNVLGLTLGPRS